MASFPTFAVDLVAPKVLARSILHGHVFALVLGASLALLALDHGERGWAEVAGLVACMAAALALPALARVRRLDRYPDAARLLLERQGFRLPWLGASAPGPEGPWESLRSFRVHAAKGARRLLVLDFAAGRFLLDDRSLGRDLFEAALAALERAVGPEGVLLGTVQRLPLKPPDPRPALERHLPRILAVAVTLTFVVLAAVSSTIVVRILAALAAVLAVLFASALRPWERSAAADLALALDGVVLPLPPDFRRTVKLPFAALRRGEISEQAGGRRSLVIEHEHGRIDFPLEWFDVRLAREFTRQLSRRTGS